MKNDSKYYVFYNKEEYDDYLMHYGVKNMKWGVRKAVEYTKKGAKAVARGAKKAAKATRSQAQAIAKKIKAKRALSVEKKNTKTSESAKVNKDTKNMSDKELADVIKRMEQEKRYRDVYNQLHPKEETFRSRLSEAAKKGVTSGVQTLIAKQIPEIGGNYIKELMADPVKKQQSQLNMKKNIVETEAWIKEFESTGKRPDWEIGKGSGKQAQPNQNKQEQKPKDDKSKKDDKESFGMKSIMEQAKKKKKKREE